jgi:hypothetical protein
MKARGREIMEQIDRYALPVGAGALLLCFLLGPWPGMRVQFFNSYLFAWLFWLSLSMGGMALSMMHHLTGGGWGRLIRPITNSAAQVLPVMFVLFLPLLFGMSILFPWARAAELAGDPIIHHLRPYMNPLFFSLRYVIYFVIWIWMAYSLTNSTDAGSLRRISAGGLVVYVITMTLAGVDWIMSRQAHWSSSVFGFILVIAQTLSALCFAVVILWRRIDRPQIAEFARPKHFIDLGNLLLMFIILWAYMNFSQYLITWTGNEQADIGWYVQRTYGGWRVVAGIIIFIHFLLPFFLLLMRPLKQNLNSLGTICLCLLALRILDLYWNIGPQAQTDSHGGFIFSPLDVLAWIGIGGIWYAGFSFFLGSAPLLALTFEDHGLSYGTSDPQSA